MSKPVTGERQPQLRLKQNRLAYSLWLVLGNKVKTEMTASVALYPTPNPTLVQLTTHLTALQTTIANLGTRHNKGGKAAIIAVRVAVENVQNDLKLLAAYVLNTLDRSLPASVQAANINASGFTQKDFRSLIPSPQFAKFFKQSNTKKFPSTLRRLSWKKPLGLIKGGRITSYNVYDATTGAYLLTTTKTNVLMNTGTLSSIKKVTIKPMSRTGEGNSFTATVV